MTSHGGDDLTVVVPSFDEAANLPETVRDLRAAFAAKGLRPHVLIVDDGSRDATPSAAAELVAEDPERTSVETHPKNRGLGSALRTGYQNAKTAWVGWTAADGQIAPEDLVALYIARDGHVVVTGRIAAAERKSADGIVRLVVSKSFRVVMKTLHPRMPLFNGVMVVRRDAFDADVLVCRMGYVNMEILDRIRKRTPGASVRELPISVRPRRSGGSKVANARGVGITLADLARLRLRYWLGR